MTDHISIYREWHRASVTIGSTVYTVATKPGVFSHGRIDPAALLLAEHARIEQGDVVVSLNCGNGMTAAIAAVGSGASRVFLSDRNVVNAEAARRTLQHNGVTNGIVAVEHGARSLPADTTADVVTVRIPRERLALLELLADAFRLLRMGGRCYVAGATNEGIRTAATILGRIFGDVGVLGRDSAHRVVMAVKGAEHPSSSEDLDSPFLDPLVFNEIDTTLRGVPTVLHSRPGVFSWDHLDEATALLAEQVVVKPGESVLDLGCGTGALGVVAARLSGTGRITMIDADAEAVRSASRTAERAGLSDVETFVSDVATFVLDRQFDVVVTNPPFHTGKATDLNVPLQFIADAWEVLVPAGRFYLVANRTLPYEMAIKGRFGNIVTVHDGPRFKVLSATRE